MKKQALIISDDPLFYQLPSNGTDNELWGIDHTALISEALRLILNNEYCLLVLDLQLQNRDRAEMIQLVRIAKYIPILALTDPLEPDEKIKLLQTGVDAYVEKPINLALCMAQAKALIRLHLQADDLPPQYTPLVFGTALIIRPLYRQILVHGKPLELTKKEFDLLHFFARRPLQVFSREQLFDQIWDYNFELGGNETVKVHVNNLRRKLMVLGYNAIENIRGVGYRFIPPN